MHAAVIITTRVWLRPHVHAAVITTRVWLQPHVHAAVLTDHQGLEGADVRAAVSVHAA